MRVATITLGLLIAFAAGVVVGMVLPRPGVEPRPPSRPVAVANDYQAPALASLGSLLETEYGWHCRIDGETLLARRDDAEEHLRFTRDGSSIRSAFYELDARTWGKDAPSTITQANLVDLCGKTMDVPPTVLALLINSALAQPEGHDGLRIEGKMITAIVNGDKLFLTIEPDDPDRF